VVYNDLEDLIEKIKYYLKHSEERKKIARNAKELYDKEYNIEERAKELREFIKNKFNIKDDE
jgi:spore maturation protein CgeB